MRTIKFRNWDGHNMEYFDDLYWFEENGVHSSDETKNAAGGINLMQFTGLLDKNGKEIYEMDVVLLWDEPDRSQVIYDLQLAHALMSECILSDSCRIIGNTYENPELLGEKK